MAKARTYAARPAKVTFEGTNDAALETILKSRIRERGPINIAQYMDAALYHPDFGYYVAARPIGAQGDFVTSPEISQMFGELIGLWCLQAWRDIGAPADIQIIELGPGRGTLMQDALRAARQDPAFLATAQICLVERNHHLKSCQAQALSAHDNVKWYADFADIPKGPFILIANEFFDCLPIRQFVFKAGAWRERMVGLAPSGQLTFQINTEPVSANEFSERVRRPQDGDILETSATSVTLIADIVERLNHTAGRAVIIDYGHDGSGYGDTLQAISRHQFARVLQNPGCVDITAHVDFSALANAAQNANGVVDGPVGQGNFLAALGLQARAEALKARATTAQAAEINRSVDRLINPGQMGNLFKIICLSSPALPAPPGFRVADSALH